MTRDTIVILGIPIDNLTMDETVAFIFNMIQDYANDGRPRQVATLNVDFAVNTLSWGLKRIRHPELLDVLRKADLVTADGMPIVWTSKLLGAPLKERVTGADLVPMLAEAAAKYKKSIYFLGGRGDVGRQAADLLKGLYPDLTIAGVNSPFVHIEGQDLLWAEDEDLPIVEHINSSGADILLIGFGNPKQELWFHRNRNRLKVPVSIGIGGTYEFITGSVVRAPEWMQRAGLEWVFRIIQDPKRLWKRYFLGFFKFGLMILPAILYYRYKRFLDNLFHRRGFLRKNQGTAPLVSTGSYINVIRFPGRLDAAFLKQFKDEMEKAKRKPPNVALDFSQTSFVDSSGLGLIVKLWRRAAKEKQDLFLIDVKPPIAHFFKLNRVWDIFHERICEDMNEILATLREKKTLPPFYLVMEAEDEVIVISLFGRLDAAEMSNLDMEDITRNIGSRNCILNLGNLDFVDSTGLTLFIKILRHISSKGKVCLICELKGNIKQMFRITRIINLFQIVPDIPSAKKVLNRLV